MTELALALFVFGGSAGAMDVAMNAHGAVIEARRGKPCMSSMHGAFSVGALVGAGLGAVMLSAGYAPWEHTLTSSLIAVAVGCICFLFLLPAKVDRGSGPRRRARLSRTILILGMLGAIAMMAEGAMVDWSAVYMRDVVGAAIAQEGWAFAGFSAAMAVVRVGGDRLSVWFGRQVLMWISTGIAMAGCFLMAALPGLWTGVLGATLVGIGVANCVPLVFAAAARVGGTGAAGGGLAMVAGLSYCGFLLGPPIVGGLSELFSLRISLAVIGALLLVVAVVRLPGADSDRPRG
ncbi:MAG: MFS transporter [Alphaproteobacteria bacterium]